MSTVSFIKREFWGCAWERPLKPGGADTFFWPFVCFCCWGACLGGCAQFLLLLKNCASGECAMFCCPDWSPALLLLWKSSTRGFCYCATGKFSIAISTLTVRWRRSDLSLNLLQRVNGLDRHWLGHGSIRLVIGLHEKGRYRVLLLLVVTLRLVQHRENIDSLCSHLFRDEKQVFKQRHFRFHSSFILTLRTWLIHAVNGKKVNTYLVTLNPVLEKSLKLFNQRYFNEKSTFSFLFVKLIQ